MHPLARRAVAGMVPVIQTTRRVQLTAGLAMIVVPLLELTMQLLRPDVVTYGRPKDLSALGREIRPRYDFIVVGGGSAGATLAGRLSEVPSWSVLLVEAGPEEPVLTDVPAATGFLRSPNTEWGLFAEPDPRFCQAMNNQRCQITAGRVLGGTSTLNGLVYTRGNRRDFDNWAKLGNTGWSYEDVLPYFKKSEDMRVPQYKGDTKYHATGGPLTLEEFRYESPLVDYFIKGVRELGHPISDFNGADQRGFIKFYGTVRDGLRCNTAKAFIRPAWKRPNLDIALDSHVNKILIDPNDKKAYGVEFIRNRVNYTVMVDKEVIISGGVYNSPKILMLSGVGPKEHLEEVGVQPVIADLKVGYNFQDHIALGGNVYLIDRPKSITLPGVVNIGDAIRFLVNLRGPAMTVGVSEVLGFFSTKYADDPEWPDIAVYFESITDNNDGGVFKRKLSGISDDFFNAVYEPIIYRHSYGALATIMRPYSRGRVSLRSADPRALPVVHLNYMHDERDVRTLVAGAQWARRLAETSVMKELGARPNPNPFPGCQNLTQNEEAYFECALKFYSISLWHYAGTCKMGPASDPDAVVDPRLRVYGVRNLRVADASVMPVVTTGNTNAPTIMIAEKLADMLKEDWGIIPTLNNGL